MLNKIKRQLFQSAKVKELIAEDNAEEILEIGKLCSKSILDGGKIMLCGNGGSAADCQHIATELVVRLTSERDRKALPAIALTTDTSLLTACANDYGFESVFSRQVEALGKKGDVLIAISTSGNSANVLKAAEAAKEQGVIPVGLSGGSGGKLKDMTDICLVVPSEIVQYIQESHIAIGHNIVGVIESEMFSSD